MYKTEDGFADGNIVYPKEFFQEAEPLLTFEKLSPEYRARFLSIIDGTYKPEKEHKEGFNPIKKLRQIINKFRLLSLERTLLQFENIRQIHSREDFIENLDYALTHDTSKYVFHIAKLLMTVYGSDSSQFTEFVHAAKYHPQELERYTWNIEDRDLLRGKPEGRLNFGIATVVNRRWLPKENIQRYETAKAAYKNLLEDKVSQHTHDHTEDIRNDIETNLLFMYLQDQKKVEA